MEDVAVIMSVYRGDRANYTKQAVESILNQTYTQLQLWVIFDGEVVPDVEAYFEQCQQQDSRIKLFKRTENKGLAKSLNEMLDKILIQKNFKFIARMDADDIAIAERIEKQVKFLREHPSIDCVGTWAIEIDSQGNEYFRKKMPESHQDCVRQFMLRDCFIHPTVMFRAEYFKKAGLYPEDTGHLNQDSMMWAKGLKAGCQFANLPEYLLLFRLNETFFKRRQGLKQAWDIFTLRIRINRMLKYPAISYLFALAYFGLKLLPPSLLDLAYRKLR
jgi:glycosyltransferase involved in cell wall biosynthesis